MKKRVSLEENKKKKNYITGNVGLGIERFNNAMWPGNDNNNPGTYEAMHANCSGETGNDCSGAAAGGDGGALMEDKFFATKYEKNIDVPSELHILKKANIEKAISKLAPMEKFEVGYLTPVYFFKELTQLFTLLKATIFEGFTKVDFIDANVDADRDEITKMSQQKIALGSDNGVHADFRPRETKGDFSAKYADTNATVIQNHKDVDTGDTDFKTILFYPEIGSRPKVRYYLDMYDGNGYMKLSRDVLEKTVLKLLMDKKDEIVSGVNKDGTPRQRKGSDRDFIDKLHKSLAQDEATIEANQFEHTKNIDYRIDKSAFTSLNSADPEAIRKHPVRALYTNQIFYLKTPYDTLGSPITEELQLEKAELSGGHSKDKFKPDGVTRYVRRYYIKPQQIFCSNKTDVLDALIEFDDQDMTIYTMNNLPEDDKNVMKLTNRDVIYYYEDGILYDKNGVKILPQIKIRDEENRDTTDVGSASEATLRKIYADRLTGLTESAGQYIAYGQKINNVPEYAKTKRYILAHRSEDGLWFYGAWNDYDACVKVFDRLNRDMGGGYQFIINTNLPDYDPNIAIGFKDKKRDFMEKLNKKDKNEFDLSFDSYNAYGEKLVEGRVVGGTCVICGEDLEENAHDADPYKKGKCCEACYEKFVLPSSENAK